jgi:hypothetical protein
MASPFGREPAWPTEFAERLAMAGFDSHAAVLAKTNDNTLAIKAMWLWTLAYQADLEAGNDAPRPELAQVGDGAPEMDDEPETRPRTRDAETEAILDKLILDASTEEFDPADVAWAEETTRGWLESQRKSPTAPVVEPL